MFVANQLFVELMPIIYMYQAKGIEIIMLENLLYSDL